MIVRAVALVEVDEELHDLDLVADVEVGGRLVEDEDRRRLGERDGDEHELALAHRQPPGVAVGEMTDADPLDGRLDRVAVGRSRSPLSGGSCGRRPRATTSWTGIANGSWASSGTTAIVRRDRLAVERADRFAAQPDAAGARLEDAGQDAQERRLAGAVRADEGEPLARRRATRLASATIVRSPYATVTASARKDRRGHSSYPERVWCEQDQEERRAEDGHDDPDREVAQQPRDEVGGDQQDRPDDRRDRDDPSRRRPDEQPDDVRHDQPDEPDQAGDRDRRRGGHRGQDEQDARARAGRRCRGGAPRRRRAAARRATGRAAR